MGYRRRRALLEVLMYTFLALQLMGFRRQEHETSTLPQERTPVPCTVRWVSPRLE
jgi:hypothetical protein